MVGTYIPCFESGFEAHQPTVVHFPMLLILSSTVGDVTVLPGHVGGQSVDRDPPLAPLWPALWGVSRFQL